MFCPKCGTTVPDNTTFCPNCSTQMTPQTAQQPAQQQPQYAPLPEEKPSSNNMLWLILSIISLFCCQPVGVAALVCSIVAIAMENPEQAAEKCGKWAKILSLVALGLGVLVGVFYFLYMIVMIAAATSK